ncbi:hypothetical protein J437_LFUL000961 [Ladona fulva]|uniref:Uncharacterized protein n=1 Tax=Ladona fulva TaxID=123851 RepID=A0A8K0P6C0_LADFU|nr:hypothetical protein J437_LFUL000961 [Ladona fulva]
MAPPVARKKDLESENAELRKATDIQQEFSAFREVLSQARKELPESSPVISVEERFIAFEGKILQQINCLTRRSDALEERMDSLEQYSRRNCLLVHGVEETPEENCLKTAVTLFRDKLNVQIDVRRLDRAHRVGKPKSDDKPRPVIVKFVSY